MSVVEIHCPRCGSAAQLENEQAREYCCDQCGTMFVLLDTPKREEAHTIEIHVCPICGHPVDVDEGITCTECGQTGLCRDCVDENDEHNYVCRECIKKEKKNCEDCGKYSLYTCSVCGRRACREHCNIFDLMIGRYAADHERNIHEYFSVDCPTCGVICRFCIVKEEGPRGEKTYHCKKCGNKVELHNPRLEKHAKWNAHPL